MDNTTRINTFKEFLETKYLNKIFENKSFSKKRVTVDFNVLAAFSPELADELLAEPDEVLKAGDIALTMLDADGFHVRIRGDLPAAKWRIRDLRSNTLNKFITIEGTIETKTQVHSKMTMVRYECPSCGQIIPLLQLGDEVVEPRSCGCGRRGSFRVQHKELLDCFTMKVQELSSALKYGSGLQSINVLCNGDLTDSIIEEKLIEGIRVKINGIYKEKEIKKNGIKQTHLISYLDANYIQLSDETYYDIDLTSKDIQAIKEYARTPDLIKTIAERLFEGVHCDEKIKEALVLQAFGGVSNYTITPKVRGDIHILLVGDTGMNKSVYCEYVSHFSPKTVLAVGKTVSAVGLSGCPVKDDMTNNWVLKPGAIPLANNATMIIDEFDKMKAEDRDIILEPMEQQCITINKANLTERKMLARESFLITMNPKNSYFSEFETVYSQIDLPTTILNRFDLIYALKKNRTKSEDTYKKEFAKAKTMLSRSNEDCQKRMDEFHKFIRKYIAYAKQNIKPTCSRYITEEYLPDIYARFDHDLKDKQGMFPISARHVWIIKRLAEARRRIMLGDEVTREDIDYAMSMLKGSLEDIAIDIHTGTLDADWIVDSVGSGKKKILYLFEDVYNLLKDKNGIAEVQLIVGKLNESGFTTQEIDSHIESLMHRGDFFEPRRGFIKRI